MVAVRQAVPGDADAICRIWLGAWRVGYRGLVPDEALERRTDEAADAYWRATLADPAKAALVVVAEAPPEGVVGFAQAGPPEPEVPGYDWELWKLYIDPRHHRRGIGRRRLAEMADRLTARGGCSLMLRALVGNAAGGFYERLGGRCLGEEPYEILGAPVQTVLYGWPDLAALRRGAEQG